jgi:3-methyl-2-oxobutanoate hydroxymethyltransferase
LSKVSQKKRVMAPDVKAWKGKRKISMVTCYDSAFAKIVDASNVDMVLVGDSVGNVMLGYENTLPVSVNDMIHHAGAVCRAVSRVFVAVDMPFGSYQVSIEQAVENAIKIVQATGAQAVKLEGGEAYVEHIRAIIRAGIPVIGHLGLTPQSINVLGGYKVQGKGSEGDLLLADARALEKAGVMALVLELIPATLAQRVTDALAIPTIGIGAGVGCDGQVLVLQDMLGFDESFQPKFLKKYLNLGDLVGKALDKFDAEVKDEKFPSSENAF